MAITDTLRKIADLLPEESGEAKALLAEAKREVNSLYDDLKSANSESAKRKEVIRELKSELEGKADFGETENKLKAEIERLCKVEAEYQDYLKAEDIKVVNSWTEKAKVFEVQEHDKRYERIQAVKADFAWAAEGKTLTAAEAKSNLEKLGLLEKAGAFAMPETQTPNTRPPDSERAKLANPFAGKFK